MSRFKELLTGDDDNLLASATLCAILSFVNGWLMFSSSDLVIQTLSGLMWGVAAYLSGLFWSAHWRQQGAPQEEEE